MELYLQKSKPTGHNKTKKNHKEKNLQSYIIFTKSKHLIKINS